jgi:hypothetical protein
MKATAQMGGLTNIIRGHASMLRRNTGTDLDGASALRECGVRVERRSGWTRIPRKSGGLW